MSDGTEEEVNSFRQLFQENLMDFHNKDQVWKLKLQSCPEPSRVGHGIYCANNIHSNDIVTHVLKVIEKKNGPKIEIAIHQEAVFQTDSKRKIFYKSHNISDETERIYLNHRKVPTIYCPPEYHNILAIHLLSALSSDPDSKYLTS